MSEFSRLSEEWWNSNLSKAYPLADDTGGIEGTLPSALLCDALFLVSDGVDPNSLYFNRLTVSDTCFTLGLGGRLGDGSYRDFGNAVTVAFATEKGSSVSFLVEQDYQRIEGEIVVGLTSCVRDWPASTELLIKQGRIFRGCIKKPIGWVSGIKVDDKVYTGVVDLVAGDGVTLDVTTNPESKATTITIKNIAYELPGENEEIIDDTSLLNKFIEEYGKPISTICGVGPDEEGNISIRAKLEGNYFDATGENGVITVGDASGPDDCADDGTIESLADNLAALNDRAGVINEAITAVDNAVNNLGMQLTKI